MSRPADRWLRVLLGALVALPPLVVFGGTEAGVSFTMYREPKLAALGLLGWSFVLAFLWCGSRASSPSWFPSTRGTACATPRS
jgi:hypothetical protein